MSDSTLDAYLASNEPVRQTRCSTCLQYPQMLPIIQEFLDRKQKGEHHLPIQGQRSLHKFLVSKGFVGNPENLIRHIKYCLKRDIKTGASLE